MADPICPRCGQQHCSRRRREGLRQFVMARLGYFPWECSLCRKQFYLTKRGKRRKRRHDIAEKPSISTYEHESSASILEGKPPVLEGKPPVHEGKPPVHEGKLPGDPA